MVYRLACPSCSKVVEHPFVRAGAVAVCSGCRTVWRTEPGHITRTMTSACVEEKPGPAQEVDLKASEVPRRSPGSSGAGDTAIVGLSGLSEVMRQGADAGNADHGSDASPPPQGRTPVRNPAAAYAPPANAQSPSQRRSLEAARRRRRRTLLVLFMALTVMVGTLGVSVALLAAKQRAAEQDAQAQIDNANLPVAVSVSPPLRPARALDLDDPLLSSRGRNDVRAVAEPGNDTALLPVRLIATEDAPPSPIELIITATTDGRITHAWTLTEPRPLTRQQGLRLFARLPGAPDHADPAGWIVTATAPGN